jgi:hypothetical protein
VSVCGSAMLSMNTPLQTGRTSYLETWRQKCGKSSQGWISPSEKNTPLKLNNVLNRQILPALNRCEVCDVSARNPNPRSGG